MVNIQKHKVKWVVIKSRRLLKKVYVVIIMEGLFIKIVWKVIVSIVE